MPVTTIVPAPASLASSAFVASLEWDGNQNIYEGAVVYYLAEDGEFEADIRRQPVIDGFKIQGGDQQGFPGPLAFDGTLKEALAVQGGAIFANGYARYLQITNNVMQSNGGAYAGAIRLGTPHLAGALNDNENDFVRIANNRILANGGVNLAGAVGLWDAGVAKPFPADRVVLAGVSDLDPPERVNIERSGAAIVGAGLDTLVAVQNAIDAAPVYVHFDSDVLESIRPEKLYDLLEAVADESEIVGVQVNIEPEYVDGTVGALEPLLKEANVRN